MVVDQWLKGGIGLVPNYWEIQVEFLPLATLGAVRSIARQSVLFVVVFSVKVKKIISEQEQYVQ